MVIFPLKMVIFPIKNGDFPHKKWWIFPIFRMDPKAWSVNSNSWASRGNLKRYMEVPTGRIPGSNWEVDF